MMRHLSRLLLAAALVLSGCRGDAAPASGPAPSEPTPAPGEPAPAPGEPAPAPDEPAPAPGEPTPAPDEPEPAPTEPAPGGAEPNTPPAADALRAFVYAEADEAGQPVALRVSSQGTGGPPTPLTAWAAALVDKARAEAEWDALEATVAKACDDAPGRPPELARGATVRLITASGVSERQIGTCSATEMGGDVTFALALSGPSVAGPAVAAIGAARLADDARLVPLSAEVADGALAASLWEQLAPRIGLGLDDEHRPATTPPPGALRVYREPLGAGRTGLVELCLPEEGAGGGGSELDCMVSVLAVLGEGDRIVAWLRHMTEGPEVSPPTRGALLSEATYGLVRPLAVLHNGGRVAVLTTIYAIGNEIYDLLHLTGDGVGQERLFELIVE